MPRTDCPVPQEETVSAPTSQVLQPWPLVCPEAPVAPLGGAAVPVTVTVTVPTANPLMVPVKPAEKFAVVQFVTAASHWMPVGVNQAGSAASFR